MNDKIIALINKYWKFDDTQDTLSNWHDKNDLLAEISELSSREHTNIESLYSKEEVLSIIGAALEHLIHSASGYTGTISNADKLRIRGVLSKFNHEIKDNSWKG